MNFDTAIRPTSFYLHWPFCPYKCHFCDFVALAGHDQYMEQYHRALLKEMDLFFSNYPTQLPIETLYIGGGTPSTYPINLLLDTFGRLRDATLFGPHTEITIEVNPGTVSSGQLDAWQELGINRISVGVQSLNDAVLKKLNRHQAAHDVVAVLNEAQERFDNISTDLIIGLPGISSDEWKEIVTKVVQWPVKHLSIYFLMVHESTPLYFGVKTNKVVLPCDDEVVDLYYWTIDFLAKYGFEQYEISSFARPGFQSRHNRAYWERKAFKAFGLGACSFDGIKRFQNQKNLMAYMQAAEHEQPVTVWHEELSREQIWLEKIMLGLRQTQGVCIDELMDYLNHDEKEIIYAKIAWLQEHTLITYDRGRIRLTPKALAVENEVIGKLSL